MPRFQYRITGKVEDLLRSEEAFRPLAAEIRKNVASVLRDYEVNDAPTRRDLLGVLAALDCLEDRVADALKELDEARGLESKPGPRLMGGKTDWAMRAILDARSRTRDRTSPEYQHSVHDSVRHLLDSMPYEVVRDDVKAAKSSLEMTTEVEMLTRVRSVLEPMAAKTGSLSSSVAHALPLMRWGLTEGMLLKSTLLDAIGGYLAAHTKENGKKDIWPARNVELEAAKNYPLVKVAVWDGGSDVSIFQDRVAKDRSGQPAIIAFDIESRRTTGALRPLTSEQERRYPEVVKYLKGMSDMGANLDTPEAAELRALFGGLKPDQVRPFQDELSFFRGYVHGTHVAGILMEGNPYARLVVGRSTGENRMVREFCPSAGSIERGAQASQAYVDFFKAQGVRVVNMSWGGSVKLMETVLEQCGIGKPGEDRERIARQWFGRWKESLERAFRSAPGILFVAAAGNSNSDTGFDEDAPGALRLPNLVTVGAVDTAGDATSFTSYGPAVAVYANGDEVESYIPGGGRLKISGTSMAAPNVANLAAKILAVNPKRTPPEVIALIRQTSDSRDGGRLLIHPKNAVAAARGNGRD